MHDIACDRTAHSMTTADKDDTLASDLAWSKYYTNARLLLYNNNYIL